MEDFFKPKIVYSETNDAINTKICFDIEKHLTDKTCFIVVSDNEHILKHVYRHLSSPIFAWYMRCTSPLLGSGGISLTKETVETFPLCPIKADYGLTKEEKAYMEGL